MAFNKNKALESALKFLHQGKVAQAIGEYKNILRNDPKDQATLMTVGDLFARQGDMPQAIEYFERLAQVYLHDGFNSKAIAIYKKIAKLAPNELAPLERLADLYVQQGVLSEARPLFLQNAEAHLKANRAPKAVEVLHRLLEIEPDSPRVQMRLAELYNVTGQKKEAAKTYFGYAQRLFERGETEEAQKLIERALEVDSGNAPAMLLKARILSAAHHDDEAVEVLARHPEADAGGEVTDLLVEIELKSGRFEKVAERARQQLALGSNRFGLLFRVADSLIGSERASEALPLLRELREPMIEVGEQDKFVKSLSSAVERLPGNTDALQMLADFCRQTSDPLPLNAALSQLADAYAAAGDYPRAEEVLQELIERNKDDERLAARLEKLRARANGSPPEEPISPELTAEEPATEVVSQAAWREEAPTDAESPSDGTIAEEALDEETRRYIAQALTDVDLFSSYGLTQKATHLLESVLQRAPRHTPALERLLDISLGAGNDRRTAELAAQLEQIHTERGDTVNAERFTELRQRYQKVAGLATEESAAPAEAAAPQPIESQAAVTPVVDESVAAEAMPAPQAPAGRVEFEIPLVPVEPETANAEASPTPAPVAPPPAEPQPPVVKEEVDLSDEWEAMVQEVDEPAQAATQEVPPPPEPVPSEAETVEAAADPEPQPVAKHEPAPEPAVEPPVQPAEEPAEEIAAAETVSAGNGDFELELNPEPAGVEAKASAATADDFLSELAAEVDGIETPEAAPTKANVPETVEAATPAPVAAASAAPVVSAPVPETMVESLNQLAEVFQEFRSDMDEMADEDEDLETHYNLGIAYREMGLLDEAIGEFQKVAKAVQKGKPFSYAMNCSTLLALSFMDKGEARIASLWYQRALETPGLDQETIMALRYDMGVALETAGESSSALDSFRQVYAMNIDYRDVADRITILQKH
jgi:pilus assembly protein FimV